MSEPAEMDDDTLAQAFADRAPAALAQAYRRYGNLLYSVARNAGGSTPDAEDAVHDAILRVWTGPNGYRMGRGSLRAFLVVCVRNEALSRRRNAARHARIEEQTARRDEVEADRFTDVDHVELARLRAAVAALPAEQRSVLELAYFGGLSQSEIAARLRVPLGTIKSRASIALRKLALSLSTPAE